MTLGKRIKAARERLSPKPTQGQIGKMFGITDKAVSAWERDDAVPDLDKIAKLAKVLQVPCIWLLEGSGKPPAPDSLEAQIDTLDPRDRELLGAMFETFRKQRNRVA